MKDLCLWMECKLPVFVWLMMSSMTQGVDHKTNGYCEEHGNDFWNDGRGNGGWVIHRRCFVENEEEDWS